MKKIAPLFILLIVMAGPQVMAQSVVPTAPAVPAAQGVFVPTASGAVAPSAPVTSQPTAGVPILYFSMGAGTALIGSGFGTEGNPWLDASEATLANGYGDSFNPSEAFVALVGFNLDKNWSTDLSLENYSFVTANSSASNEVNVIPALRYTFFYDEAISPFLSAGFGFNFNTTSAVATAAVLANNPSAQAGYNTQVASNAVASGGVGLLIKINGFGHFYAAGQYQQVFTPQGGFSYYPLSIGFQYP